MRKAKPGPWSAPSHSFILRHTSAFSSQVSLHLSPQHFSNRSSGDGSHNKQQEIMWDSHHHTSAGVRSPAPASTFKKEPKKNQFMPWWDSDCNQHPVTHHNDKIHCAIVRDESTPWLHSCLQFPAKLFHHLFQEWSLPRIFSQIYSPVWYSYTCDDPKKLKIDNPQIVKLFFFLLRKTDLKVYTRNFHQENRKLRRWLYLSLSCHWSSLW